MPKKRTKNRKTIPLNTKSLGNDISAYPFVEIKWLDIEGDAGWSNTKDLKKEELPVCVSKGYLLSQSKGITRIFTDYILKKYIKIQCHSNQINKENIYMQKNLQ